MDQDDVIGRGPARGALDLVLALDTTGSMGTHAATLARGIDRVLAAAARSSADPHVGVVAFKDHGAEGEAESYLVRALAPTRRLERVRDFLRAPELRLGHGGGGAEAVECALRAAARAPWRQGARRALVLVGDKPPHGGGLDGAAVCPHGVDWRDEVEALAGRGVEVHAVQVGRHLVTRRVFEWVALRTGGTFRPLDHVRHLPEVVAGACAPERAAIAAA